MSVHQTRLFVIVDPTADHQVALVKALLIAKLGRCQIHAFLCTYKELEDASQFKSRKDFKKRSLDDAGEWLEKVMKPCEISGGALYNRSRLEQQVGGRGVAFDRKIRL